jgi:hypothetical protein
MRLEDYTADAICRTMGLPAFIEDSWAKSNSSILRFVFTPSFHPEVCVTLSRINEACRVTINVLREQFWNHLSSIPKCDRADVQIAPSVFDEAISLFGLATRSSDHENRFVCTDGMGIEGCLVHDGEVTHLREHVNQRTGTEHLARLILETTWQLCPDPRVANGLANAAGYVGCDLELRETLPEPPRINLLVLGTESERQEYFEMLRKHKKPKEK